MRPPILNCDLGEGEPPEVTLQLMRHLGAANLACGAHAGSEDTMRFGLRLALELGVAAGAHPGPADRPGRGRGPLVALESSTFLASVTAQYSRLADLATEIGVAVRHLKLHGAWYHAVEADPLLAETYLRWVASLNPMPILVVIAGGQVAVRATRLGLPVWEEAFLDRGYRADGSLIPRTEPGALMTDPARVEDRILSLRQRGGWPAGDGSWVALSPQTLCVHGDSPGSLGLVRAAAAALRDWDQAMRMGMIT